MKAPEIKRLPKINALKALLNNPKKITIIAHHNPDADALGSSLGIARYLRKKGHTVEVIMPSSFPGFLDWLPGCEQVIAFSSENETLCTNILVETEIIFCLDFSTANRLKYLDPHVKKSKAKKIVIDHHQNPDLVADFWLWDTSASSTAELIYDFIEMMGDKELIDTSIGECIYAGIVTDTSSFKYPSTTKRVHLITAELMDLGVNTSKVQRFIYDNNSESRLRFIGYALTKKLKVLPEFRTAYFVITQKELALYNNKLGDTEGLVNYALSITNIVFATIIIEKKDCIKMSFRSVGQFPVNEFAKKHFGGGGHNNAAGSDCMADLNKTEELFLSLLPQYKEQLLQVNV